MWLVQTEMCWECKTWTGFKDLLWKKKGKYLYCFYMEYVLKQYSESTELSTLIWSISFYFNMATRKLKTTCAAPIIFLFYCAAPGLSPITLLKLKIKFLRSQQCFWAVPSKCWEWPPAISEPIWVLVSTSIRSDWWKHLPHWDLLQHQIWLWLKPLETDWGHWKM